VSLAEGHDFKRVSEQQLRYARKLLADGVTFSHERAADHPGLLQLVRAHVPGAEGFSPDENTQAVLAVDADGGLLAAAAIKFIRTHDVPLAVHLWQLAVVSAGRRRGLGTVLLSMLPQVAAALRLPPPTITYGVCDVPLAGFYQQAGFTVLAPGDTLPFLFGGPAANTNRHHPCWMYRGW
jgi:GNAT superfamily N-acetyltransferase